MNDEKCKEWNKEKLKSAPKNPLTNRKIKQNGPKYKELDKLCNNLSVDINALCKTWLKDNHPNLYNQFPNSKTKTIGSTVEGRRVEDSLTESDGSDNKKFFTIKERNKYKNIIKNYFSSVTIQDGKACVTNTKTLLKYVDSPTLLGSGAYGNVYSVNIPVITKPNDPRAKARISPLGEMVAIKEGRVTRKEFNKAMNKQYPMEYLFNKLINDLIKNKTCPNFPYTFAIFFCNKCTLYEPNRKTISTQCSETVMELFSFTLDKLNDLRTEVVLSILFQLLYAISTIQSVYGMFHNDVKTENILIKVIPSGGYWVYNINNQSYYVPNCGYIAILNDFGVSVSFKPGISKHDYGRRQAKVSVDPQTGSYYLMPFTTAMYPFLDKNGRIHGSKSPKLGNKQGLTWNHFYENFDAKPSTTVDLYDMETFPVYEFHYDIVDTIFMFVGGKRYYVHPPMNVTPDIKKLLKDFYLVKPDEGWPVDRVDLFLAKHTIKKLFSFYLNTTLQGLKIEEYTLPSP
jgi:hypothetical protein